MNKKSEPSERQTEVSVTPFDKLVDVDTLQEQRRQAILHSIRAITPIELKKIVAENLADFEGDPWQANFLRVMEANPQGSFYHAVTSEGVIVLYSRDEDTGVWVLPQSGMGPLPDVAKNHVRQALGLSDSSDKSTAGAQQFVSKFR